MKKPIYFDIETAGLTPRGDKASSILSISYGNSDEVREMFSRPQYGTFVSQFSQQTIMPQVATARQTYSEANNIRKFVEFLEANPQAPVAGYNIQGFDIPFMKERARRHGLGPRLEMALMGRKQIDVGIRAKRLLAQEITSQIERGTFREALGGAQTFSEANVKMHRGALTGAQKDAFNMLSQIRAYHMGQHGAKDAYRQVRGWKLGQIFEILEPNSALAARAHEASADILMTEKIHQSLVSGDLQKKLQNPHAARAWLASSLELKAQAAQFKKGAGSFYKPVGLDRAKHYISRIPPGLRKMLAGGALIGGALIAANVASNAFSGKDDDFVQIEGLGHKGIASDIRKQLTEFGSGYQGAANWEYTGQDLAYEAGAIGPTGGMLLGTAGLGIFEARDIWRQRGRLLSAAPEIISNIGKDFKTEGALKGSLKAWSTYHTGIGYNPRQAAYAMGLKVAGGGLVAGALGLAAFSGLADAHSFFTGDLESGEAGMAAVRASIPFASAGLGIAGLGTIIQSEASQGNRRGIKGKAAFDFTDNLVNKTFAKGHFKKVALGLGALSLAALSINEARFGSIFRGRTDISSSESWDVGEYSALGAAVTVGAAGGLIASAGYLPGMMLLSEKLPAVISASTSEIAGAAIGKLANLSDSTSKLLTGVQSRLSNFSTALSNNPALKKYLAGGAAIATGLQTLNVLSSQEEAPVSSMMLAAPKTALLGAAAGGITYTALKNPTLFRETKASLVGGVKAYGSDFVEGVKNVGKEGYSVYSAGLKAMGVSNIGRAGHLLKTFGKVGLGVGGVISAGELGYGIVSNQYEEGGGAAATFGETLNKWADPFLFGGTALYAGAQGLIGYDYYKGLEEGKTFKGRPDRLTSFIEDLDSKGHKKTSRLLDFMFDEKISPQGSKSKNMLAVLKSRKTILAGAGLIGLSHLVDTDAEKLNKGKSPSEFSGKGSAYNTVEGMQHGGLAADLRLENTDFGSPWRGLAGRIKSLFSKKGGLESAKQVKQLGTVEGWGEVYEMQGYLRGKSVDFVRKKGYVAPEEVAMQKAAGELAPEVLRELPEGGFEMRKLAGRTLEELSGQEVAAIQPRVVDAVKSLHSRGVAHGDLHLGNVFLTESNQVRFIDFGDAVKTTKSAMKTDMDDITASMAAHIKFADVGSAKGAFSGGDDAYNVIEGLQEKGFSKKLREFFGFGSGWRGLIKMPKMMGKRLGHTAFGQAGDIGYFEKQASRIREQAGLFKEAGPKELADYLGGKEGYEAFTKFEKELAAARAAGHENVMVINPTNIRKAEEMAGIKKGKLLRQVITHERVHLGARATQGAKPLQADAPTMWVVEQELAKYGAGPTFAPEEFVAHIYGVSKYETFYKAPSEIAEQLGKTDSAIEMALKNAPAASDAVNAWNFRAFNFASPSQIKKAKEVGEEMQFAAYADRTAKMRKYQKLQKQQKKIAQSDLQKHASKQVAEAARGGGRKSRG